MDSSRPAVHRRAKQEVSMLRTYASTHLTCCRCLARRERWATSRQVWVHVKLRRKTAVLSAFGLLVGRGRLAPGSAASVSICRSLEQQHVLHRVRHAMRHDAPWIECSPDARRSRLGTVLASPSTMVWRCVWRPRDQGQAPSTANGARWTTCGLHALVAWAGRP